MPWPPALEAAAEQPAPCTGGTLLGVCTPAPTLPEIIPSTNLPKSLHYFFVNSVFFVKIISLFCCCCYIWL